MSTALLVTEPEPSLVRHLTQDGFPGGSGQRTMWFAPDVGLVKLVWTHGDGSTSTVELTKQTSPST